ncbi:MAG: M23 family metallopeptidase [Chitinophagaceae bacterium]|nr:MAG: M23 family metallopeptidase [Chitinophagaceae bacterium]
MKETSIILSDRISKKAALKLLFVLILFLLPGLLISGNNHPEDYFISPLKIPLEVTGTFAELRNNHFHSGIDFRTQRREDLPVLAVADGYVSRVNVSPVGFGKAIYISHPNGYTSVYAHMNDFFPELSAYVKNAQYAQKSFNIELYPDRNQFRVKQGDIIGLSGNTGSSMGPHLHFEIRETATQMPINPLYFGFDVSDTDYPVMESLAIYPLGMNRHFSSPMYFPLRRQQKGVYTLSKDTIKVNVTQIGAGISAYDNLSGTVNRNGPYEIKLFQENQLLYHFKASTFAFSETRYLNAHIDYHARIKKNKWYNKLYLQPNNRFSMYELTRNEGVIDLSQETKQNISIEVTDFKGNVSKTSFVLQYSEPSEAEIFELGENLTLFPHNRRNTFSANEINLKFPAYSFYDTVYFQYEWTPPVKKDIHSAIHHVHRNDIPVHNFYDIKIKPYDIPAHLRSKSFICYENSSGNPQYLSSDWEGEFLKARSRDFGKFYVKIDTIPPSIRPLNIREGKNMTTYDRMTFTIEDDLSGISSYTGKLNGKWILMEYDPKNKLLFHIFEEDLSSGEHQLFLTVEDNVKNKFQYIINFKR